MGCGWVANVRNDSVPIKTGVFFPQKVGFPIEKNESLLKVKKKHLKSENQSENREILMDFSHFFKALRYLSCAQGQRAKGRIPERRSPAIRAKSQVGGNPENPGFYPTLV